MTTANPVLTASDAMRRWFARRGEDQRALWAHVRRRWYVYLPLAIAWVLAQHYLFFNWTRSLPYAVVWLDATPTFARGDLIVYRFDGDELMQLKKGQRFFKRIVGVAGDRVSVEDRRVLINGVDVGIAKQVTLDGHRLEPLRPGVIPAGLLLRAGHARNELRFALSRERAGPCQPDDRQGARDLLGAPRMSLLSPLHLLAAVAALAAAAFSRGEDLGTLGPTYAIEEPQSAHRHRAATPRQGAERRARATGGAAKQRIVDSIEHPAAAARNPAHAERALVLLRPVDRGAREHHRRQGQHHRSRRHAHEPARHRLAVEAPAVLRRPTSNRSSARAS